MCASSLATIFANISVSPLKPALRTASRVEGGLEVLERQREVQDVDIARRPERARGRRERHTRDHTH